MRSYIVTVYLYVLGSFMENWIGYNVECSLIVTYEFCAM